MLVVTYVISSNAIRSAVLARKDELITMQLVGASRLLIRGRLGIEGGLTGGLAGLIAAGVVVGICVVCFFAARHLFVQVLPGVTVTNGVQVVTGVAATGMAIGAVSALFALRRVRM
jgi:cell division protein FtsX